MKFKKITNILGVISLGLYFSIFIFPDPDVNNFPFVEMVGLLFLVFFILVSGAGIILSFVKRKNLTLFEKIFPLVGTILFLTTFIVDTYCTISTDVEIQYLGQQPEITYQLGFGEQGLGGPLKKGEVYKINMGRPSKMLYISWGQDYKKDKRKQFDVSKDIPKYGRDLILKISIFDKYVTYDVVKK
jgi:hypothetical protein